MTVAYRVDPALPAVTATDITCPGCGQTLNAIRDGWRDLPSRHYRQPTQLYHRLVTVRSSKAAWNSSTMSDLCSYTDDDLSSVVYRAQRSAAGLPPPTRRTP